MPSRVLFTESLNEIMVHAGNGHAFSIAMIDLDRFNSWPSGWRCSHPRGLC
ncbi:hypothetical protein MRBLMR1_006102 [Neorhizobium sp. LMR1-1-1.1]